MKSPRRLAALLLAIGIAGIAIAGTFAQRDPDPPRASEAPVSEVISQAGVARSELPRLGTAALLGGGLVGLALLGRKRFV